MKNYFKNLAKKLIKKAHESDSYYGIIKTLYRPKVKCRVNNLTQDNDFYIKEIGLLNNETIKTRYLKPQSVVIKESELKYETSPNLQNLLLDRYLPNVLNVQMLDNIIKWVDINTTFISTARKYPIQTFDNIGTNVIDASLQFNKLKTYDIKRSLMSINRHLTINEEIITIVPFQKTLPMEKVLKVPVEKKPVSQIYFTAQQIIKFKDELAKQNNTNLSNIEMSAIYDKINSNIYSGIKQQPNSRKLLCFFKEKTSMIKDDTMYYLILGRYKDTKATIKAIVKTD